QVDLIGSGVVGEVAAVTQPGGGRERAVRLVGVGAVEGFQRARRLGLQAVDIAAERLQPRSELGGRPEVDVLRLQVVDEFRQVGQTIVRWVENFGKHRTSVRIQARSPASANSLRVNFSARVTDWSAGSWPANALVPP